MKPNWVFADNKTQARACRYTEHSIDCWFKETASIDEGCLSYSVTKQLPDTWGKEEDVVDIRLETVVELLRRAGYTVEKR